MTIEEINNRRARLAVLKNPSAKNIAEMEILSKCSEYYTRYVARKSVRSVQDLQRLLAEFEL